LAASACSQEDYSSTRCRRLPARPQRSSMNGDTQPHTHKHAHGHTNILLWTSPPLYSGVRFTCFLSSLFYQILLSFPLAFSFIPPLLRAYSPPLFSHSHSIFITLSLTLSLSLSLSLQPFQAAGRGEAWLGQRQTGNICCVFRLLVRPFCFPVPGQSSEQNITEETLPHLLPCSLTPSFGHLSESFI